MAKLNVEIPAVNVKVDGVEYRKVDRKAQAGDIVKITGTMYMNCPVGAFFPVEDGAVYGSKGIASIVDERGTFRWGTLSEGNDWEVYEKVTAAEPSSSSDIVTHGGKQYRKVARKANVGDLVCGSDGNPNNYVVTDRVVADPDKLSIEYVNGYGRSLGIRVLEPVTEVKRNANVGERIRIVAADLAVGYQNGDVLIVELADGNGVFATTPSGDQSRVWHKEYVVLAEETEETFAVGEKVRLISDGGSCPLNGYYDGKIYEVAEENTERSGEIRITGGDVRYGYALPSQLEKVSGETPEPARIPVGSYVRILVDTEDLPEGAIAKVTDDDRDRRPYRCELLDGSDYDWYKPEQLEVVTEETAEWAAIGRKPDEYKTGDIVEATRGLGERERVIGALEDTPRDYGGMGIRLPCGKYYAVNVDGAKLVTPVEQRFDRK